MVSCSINFVGGTNEILVWGRYSSETSCFLQLEEYEKKERAKLYESNSIHVFKRYLNKILIEAGRLGLVSIIVVIVIIFIYGVSFSLKLKADYKT